MVKYCVNCGKQLDDNAKFCGSCGANMKNNSQPVQQQYTNQKQPVQQNYQTPQPQQNFQNNQNSQYAQYYGYTQTVPVKKKSGTVIGAIVALAIIIVVVIAALYFFVFSTGESNSENNSTNISGKSSILGTWQYNYNTDTITFKFNSDNSCELGSSGVMINIGSWQTQDNKLTIIVTNDVPGVDLPLGSYEYIYNISQDGNTLTMTSVEYNDVTVLSRV